MGAKLRWSALLDSEEDVLNLGLIFYVKCGLAAAGLDAGEPVESQWSSCKYVVTLSLVILQHKELPEITDRLSDRENPRAQSNSYGC